MQISQYTTRNEGLRTVAQMVELNGEFLSFEALNNFDKITIMQYNSLKTAMPSSWKLKLKTANCLVEDIAPKCTFYENCEKLPSRYYKMCKVNETRIEVLAQLWTVRLQ